MPDSCQNCGLFHFLSYYYWSCWSMLLLHSDAIFSLDKPPRQRREEHRPMGFICLLVTSIISRRLITLPNRTLLTTLDSKSGVGLEITRSMLGSRGHRFFEGIPFAISLPRHAKWNLCGALWLECSSSGDSTIITTTRARDLSWHDFYGKDLNVSLNGIFSWHRSSCTANARGGVLEYVPTIVTRWSKFFK